MSEGCLKSIFRQGPSTISRQGPSTNSRGSKGLEHLVSVDHWGKQGINFGFSDIRLFRHPLTQTAQEGYCYTLRGQEHPLDALITGEHW
jgi:hypothetical protein